MKTEDLQAKGLSQEQIDFVMAENGKDAECDQRQSVMATRSQLDTAQASLKGDGG